MATSRDAWGAPFVSIISKGLPTQRLSWKERMLQILYRVKGQAHHVFWYNLNYLPQNNM